MGSADPGARARTRLRVVEQPHELRQRERPLDRRAAVDHRRDDVLALEADHEVGVAQLARADAVRAVGGEVEPELACDRDGLRQRGLGPELERSQRGDLDRKLSGLVLEQRGRERAAEAVPGADEGDAELVAQRTCPSSNPIACSIRSCRLRTSGPVSHGAARSTRAFQTSRGSAGTSSAARR